MNKAKVSINRELDFQKFLHRQRLSTYSLLALLNPRQQSVVDKMATMAIRESSDLDTSTDDYAELNSRNEGDFLDVGRRTIQSNKRVDK